MKGRGCARGITQRSFIPKKESPSPKVTTESVLVNSVVSTKHERNFMTIDIPNDLVQAEVPKGD